MDFDMSKVRPYPTPPPDVAALFADVWPGSRTKMFGQVMAAVDCAGGDAECHGDMRYVRYVEEELFPFLEAEQERAAEEEGLTAILRWQESLFAGK